VSTSDERLARRASSELPETVNAADVTSWSDEVDVLVIGFGIAGGSAAVSAAAAGARVLVLERAAAAGGTSAMAGGHFYLGGGTAVQEATGHQDSPEEMYKYLVAVSRAPEHDKIRAYCEGSVEHFNWLEDLGFQFERSFYPGKIVVPPGTEGLSYTGNEKVWPYIEQAKPAPRGHSVPVPGELGGAAMVIDLLVKRADELGVEIRYETGATNLVVEDGSVVGVSWKHFTETGAIKAKAVIIAAGGFAMNPEMVAEHTPALGQKRRTKHHGEVEPYILGNPNDDGLGIRLGVSAGGVAKNLDQDVKAGKFREDLFYRLSVVTLRVPALKERRTDIPLLAEHFLATVLEREGHKQLTLSEESIRTLVAYSWPGNVRELESAIEYAVLHARGHEIAPEDLPEKLQSAQVRAAARSPLSALFEDLPSLDELERRYLLYILEVAGGNRTRAAEILRVDRRTLYRMIERYGIDSNGE